MLLLFSFIILFLLSLSSSYWRSWNVSEMLLFLILVFFFVFQSPSTWCLCPRDRRPPFPAPWPRTSPGTAGSSLSSGSRTTQHRQYTREYPTSITGVHLVMCCPDARAGVRIAKEREPLARPGATQISTPVTNLPLVA